MIDLHVERGHVTASVAATILGVSRQRVNQLLKAGAFVDAFLMDIGDGREMWCIPRRSVDRATIKQSLTDKRKRRKQNATT